MSTKKESSSLFQLGWHVSFWHAFEVGGRGENEQGGEEDVEEVLLIIEQQHLAEKRRCWSSSSSSSFFHHILNTLNSILRHIFHGSLNSIVHISVINDIFNNINGVIRRGVNMGDVLYNDIDGISKVEME